jgi:hypothetical protein
MNLPNGMLNATINSRKLPRLKIRERMIAFLILTEKRDINAK